MPSEKSARGSMRKAQYNQKVRNAARTRVTAAVRAIRAGDSEEAQAAATQAASALDQAASRRVIHPNNASRRKSRLAKRLLSLNQPKT